MLRATFVPCDDSWLPFGSHRRRALATAQHLQARAIVAALRSVCYPITYREALAHVKAARRDSTLGQLPLLTITGLQLLTAVSLHLVEPGAERPLCGAHVEGPRDEPEGLESDEWWRVCWRCRTCADRRGLLEYSL